MKITDPAAHIGTNPVSEDEFSVFASEVMIPTQYYAFIQDLTPEKRLCLALLEDVFTCMQNRHDYGRRRDILQLAVDMKWVRNEDEVPGSFNWCCWVLQFEPAVIRAGLTRYRKRRELEASI